MKRLAALLLLAPSVAGTTAAHGPLPLELRGTGYESAAKVEFVPQYPLWSDGAGKRRWIAIPPGTAIDKSRPDAWEFPAGTRLWKEFSAGRAVETRYIERLADGSWRFATYVWNAEGTHATLAPEEGVEVEVAGAPGGRYAVPSRNDCVACHEGPAVPVLGYSAVQLHGTVAGRTENERRALGYLHGNCGHCHNAGALDGVGLQLAQSSAAPQESRARTLASLDPARRADMLRRIASSNPYVRMPPVGVRVTDAHGTGLVERWIRDDLQPQEKPQ